MCHCDLRHTCTGTFCVNCEQATHSTIDNGYPEFLKEKDMVRLAIDKSLTKYQARRQLHLEHPLYVPPKLRAAAASQPNQASTFSEVVRSAAPTTPLQSQQLQDQLSGLITLISSLINVNNNTALVSTENTDIQ